MNSKGQILRKLQMRTLFNDPSNLYIKGVIKESYYGLVKQECSNFDNIFTPDVSKVYYIFI